MYNETKDAIKKAFKIGYILFSMGDKYKKLLEIVDKIRPPSMEEINENYREGINIEEIIVDLLKEKYKSAAISAGFTEEQGLAMLEYVSILEELDDCNAF